MWYRIFHGVVGLMGEKKNFYRANHRAARQPNIFKPMPQDVGFRSDLNRLRWFFNSLNPTYATHGHVLSEKTTKNFERLL
jgi:hypothetical protein